MSWGPAITNTDIVAVSINELNEFGCPYCGYRSGGTSMSGGGAAVWTCGECGKTCVGLGEGVTESPIGFGGSGSLSISLGNASPTIKTGCFYPKLQEHPRRGIPAHGRPDKPPAGGGEYFRPRGIGLDWTPGCFVCGGAKKLYANVSGFVQCREAGERVVAFFQFGAFLDYREREPDWIQVKVGACEAHVANLENLNNTARECGGVIRQADVNAAMAWKGETHEQSENEQRD